MKIDFLIDELESSQGDWGRIIRLTGDLGALRVSGARLAFDDAE